MKHLLSEADRCWRSLHYFRKERERSKNYTFGRQWNDMIYVDGRQISEEEFILSEGHLPLKNNLIRRIVRNIIGVFRRQLAEKMEKWDDDMKRLAAANNLYELYARSLEEFLISGMVVHKKWVGRRNGQNGIWTEMISPASFFFNPSASDSLGADFSFVGQYHEVDLNDFCDAFVSNPEQFARAVEIFGMSNTRTIKITEIWQRERRPRRLVHIPDSAAVRCIEEHEWRQRKDLHKLKSRWFLHDVWRFYFLSPDGSVLAEGDSPYPHRSHPYVFKAYPFLDREIHSFVSDTIDQQRYTNRLITMYDWIMRASAKGVLLLPEGCVAPDQIQNVANEWGRFNGVIVYRPRPGNPEPKQINGGSPHMDISELLSIQLKMLEDVSGVNSALRGNLSSNSISGSLYNQQTQNAMTSLSDILDSFASFISAASEKDRWLMTALAKKNLSNSQNNYNFAF
ncbi:MAG: hypothetical protein K2J82_11810 [Muribaculaceae bacterium]|nr:hypothetical protein [Muribaculaceae bacterium]MDE6755278.1 hypothetical protein [Muribaculaceae bacterium]